MAAVAEARTVFMGLNACRSPQAVGRLTAAHHCTYVLLSHCCSIKFKQSAYRKMVFMPAEQLQEGPAASHQEALAMRAC